MLVTCALLVRAVYQDKQNIKRDEVRGIACLYLAFPSGRRSYPCVVVIIKNSLALITSGCGDEQALDDPMEELEELARASGQKGCAYCGGLGHRIADCPKLDSQNREQQRKKKDYFGAGGFGGEM